MINTNDYIPPKMFTFCSRCGEICREGGKDFMCLGCENSFFGWEGDAKHDIEDVCAERERSSLVRVIRDSVAQSLSNFLTVLWWIPKP